MRKDFIVRSEPERIMQRIGKIRTGIGWNEAVFIELTEVHVGNRINNFRIGKSLIQPVFEDAKNQQCNKTGHEMSFDPVILLQEDRSCFEFAFDYLE